MPGVPPTLFKLRSFYLSPFSTETKSVSDTSSRTSLPLSLGTPQQTKPTKRGTTVIALGTLASLIFTFTIAVALVGRTGKTDHFASLLDDVARFNPGIVFVGEDVTVNIEESSVIIRWSLVACGGPFMLPGSKGMLGSTLCGLPASSLNIFCDSNPEPTIKYDPRSLPFDGATGHRKRPEAIFQFQTSRNLDVSEARQYPFDSYQLGIELQAMTLETPNVSEPISRVFINDNNSNFKIETSDFRRYLDSDGFRVPIHQVDLSIKRPVSARLYTLVLFVISWLLAHISIAQVVLARRSTGTQSLVVSLAISGGTIIAIPQLWSSMPDAPGLDGIVIDCIGFFPQMAVVGLCTVALLLLMAIREWDCISASQSMDDLVSRENKLGFADRPLTTLTPSPRPSRPRRPPPLNLSGAATALAQWEAERASKAVRGDYMFPPPLSAATPPPKTPMSPWKPCHQRNKTTRAISMVEAGEISRWSDGED